MSRIVPRAEEVEPWVEAIIRVWDDREVYDELSAKAVREAERWHPDRVRPLYAEFFRNCAMSARCAGHRERQTVENGRRDGPFRSRSLHAFPTKRSSRPICWPRPIWPGRARRTRSL